MLERVFVRWHRNFVTEIEDGVVVRASFTDRSYGDAIVTETAKRLKEKLEAYFSGRPVDFTEFKVRYPTEFAEKVLEEVRKIPYGRVETYSSIARKLQTSPRAVGVALRKNLVPVIVPCHRVIARNGLGGFTPGVDVKKLLLEMEFKVSQETF